MDEYVKIFDLRGSAYDRAMQAFPDARAEEFGQLIAPLDLHTGAVVGDVPAGGGYLRRFLPEHCRWQGHDPSVGFTGHGRRTDEQSSGRLVPLPWADNTLDAVVSLAGVHHLEDKRTLFKALAAATCPGGRFVLSDVEKGSVPAIFLDGFVGDWNSTGHEGRFLDHNTAAELCDSGWVVQDCRSVHFHWKFNSRSELVDFVGQLFDVSRAGPAAIELAVETGPGIEQFADGTIGMRWSLMTFTCTNAKPVEAS